MQVRKQQFELDMEQQTGSKLGKEYVKAAYCQPAYFTSYHQSKKIFKIHVCYESYNNVEEVPKSFP